VSAVLQAEVEGLHGALLAEKRAVVALREELTLMSTSRDTWRVSGLGRRVWSVARAMRLLQGVSFTCTSVQILSVCLSVCFMTAAHPLAAGRCQAC
jgi:hypothetical protein